MATELSVDIVARFDDVKRQTQQAAKGFDNLEREIKQTGTAAVVAGEQMERASTSVGKMNRGLGSTSAIAFQAGQAVSDFAVAGIRGAANNIEFLALQLGLSGPLIGAITAASVALVVFSDDIAEFVKGASVDFEKLQKTVKETADGLINLRDSAKVTFEGTADELEKDAERIGGIVEALEERRRNISQLLTREQTQNIGGVTTFLASSKEIRVLQKDLENVETVLARQKGIQESITETVKEQRLLEQVIADLGETSLNRKEEEVKKEREKVTQLDRAIEANNKLKEQLEALRNIENSRLGFILDQNDGLKDQIDIVKRLNKERAKRDGTLGDPDLEKVDGLGLGDPLFSRSDILSNIEKEEARRKALQQEGDIPASMLRVLNGETVEQIENASERSLDALRDMAEQSKAFGDAIEQGIGNAFSSLAMSIGEGANLFDSLRTVVGDFAVDIGQTMIGFGVAGLAIKASFQNNPVGAIIAGGALVALGSALKKSVEKKTEAFTAGGSYAADRSGIRPPADPRQGRDGRFRRSFESGFQPQAPFQMAEGAAHFEFKIAGEDLVAVNRRNQQRQGRTRATTRSSLVEGR